MTTNSINLGLLIECARKKQCIDPMVLASIPISELVWILLIFGSFRPPLCNSKDGSLGNI